MLVTVDSTLGFDSRWFCQRAIREFIGNINRFYDQFNKV